MALLVYYQMLTLKINGSQSAGDFRKEFSSAFPFLKIELLRKSTNQEEKPGAKGITTLPANQLMSKTQVAFDINEATTVADLKSLFLEKLGIITLVYRKSGTMWIETSLTDDWSLGRQNLEAEQMN